MGVRMVVHQQAGTRSDLALMLRLVSLPFLQDDHWWFISRWSGSLIRSTQPPPLAGGQITSKLQAALDCCEKPYSCKWSPKHESYGISQSDSILLEDMNRRFFSLGNRRFLTSIIYSSLGNRIFENTKIAFSTIAKLPGHLDSSNDRCFQRSLLAAKTSLSFRHHGVLLIGAEFSSGEMHAWIMENGEQPDPDDRTWINFRPLLALHF
jgi:hypothetical protein